MRALTKEELLGITAESLGTRATKPTDLIKPSLRRALFHLAPSSRSDLVRFVAEPLASFAISREQVESALEELIAYTDAFEMKKSPVDPWDAPSVLIRPGPPSFVQRSDGTIIILGVAGEHTTALPPDLQARVSECGPIRVLYGQDDNSLVPHLKLLGLTALTEAAWLRTPKPESSENHLKHWQDILQNAAFEASDIAELEILDTARPTRYYKGRWRQPSEATAGIFVARRPRQYGASLWAMAEFKRGVCRRLIDVWDDEDRQRPCDIAWRYQAAVDADEGHPQDVRVRESAAKCFLDFFSPLPGFAERRLALVGEKLVGTGCLFSFEMSGKDASAEIDALVTNLWMRAVRAEEAR